MPEEGITFKQLAPHPLYSPIRPPSLMTSASAAAMWGGHFPCRAPTISLFLATSNGKLMVLAVKPGSGEKGKKKIHPDMQTSKNATNGFAAP